MNASNRTLGRVLLVVVGLVMLVGGLALIALVTIPDAVAPWRDASAALRPFGPDADRQTSVTAWSIVLGVALAVGVLALVVIGTRGGGRIGTVIEDDAVDLAGSDTATGGAVAGQVRIESTAVQHALSSAIGDLPEVASLAVDVYRVRRTSALRIRVRPRRGVSPRALTTHVEEVVADLDALLGTRLPVLLHVARGGSGSSRPDRVH